MLEATQLIEEDAFEYVCPECENTYHKPEEKLVWQDGARERHRCIHCNRYNKRLADVRKSLPTAAKESWDKLNALQKKAYRQNHLLDIDREDLAASLAVYVEQVRAPLRAFSI